MERIIEIDLIDKYDLVEKYNEKNVSNELIKYIINEAMYIPKKDKIVIEINKKFPTVKNCKTLIVDGLKREYNESLRLHKLIDIKQWIFFIWGIIALFLSTLFNNEIIEEILIIGAWVPLWEVIDLEVFADHDERKKRRVLKKLLKSEIIE